MSATQEKECLPPEVVEWLGRKYRPTVGKYSASSLVRCLACAYDDHTSEAVEPTRELWKKKRGVIIHRGLTEAFSWRELRVSHSFELENETASITAKLDTYSPERRVLYDFKTTDELDWQVGNGYLPRALDVRQIQCYGTLFKQYIGINELKLIYLDKASCQSYTIPQKDMLEWLVLRAKDLHQALKTGVRPPADPDCWVCSRLPKRGGSP